MNDIYQIKKKQKRDIYKEAPKIKGKIAIETTTGSLNKKIESLAGKLEEFSKLQHNQSQVIVDKIQELSTPVINLPEVPEIQKVSLDKPLSVTTQIVKIPDIQKVKVINPTPTVKIPDIQKVELTKKLIPTGKGNKPGEADPAEYVPVRLTDGDHFYKALNEMITGGRSGAGFPFVDVNGKPKQVALDASGNLPTNSSATLTSSPSAPVYTYETNNPPIQYVVIASGITTAISGSLTTTTVSGLLGLNEATVRTVNVQSMPNIQVIPGITTAVSGVVTSVSGTQHALIDNFPTIQATFNTTTSGNQHTVVDNFPTIFTTQRTWTLASGVDNTNISNFPTVQTVNVQGMPITTISGFTSPTPGVTTAISGTTTTLSGSQIDIKNFPTVQTVNVQNLPSLNINSMPINTTVSGTVLTISGSKSDIQNFPTIQTVRDNSVTISGSQHTLVDNFPTTQSVSLASLPTLVTGTAQVGSVNLAPTAIGGWTPYLANAITTTVTVSSAAGKFGGYMLLNLNSTPAYLQVFDTVGAVTLGTTVPTFVLTLPANSTAANGIAANLELANGVKITNGIKVAATTTATGSVTVTTGLTGSIWYI